MDTQCQEECGTGPAMCEARLLLLLGACVAVLHLAHASPAPDEPWVALRGALRAYHHHVQPHDHGGERATGWIVADGAGVVCQTLPMRLPTPSYAALWERVRHVRDRANTNRVLARWDDARACYVDATCTCAATLRLGRRLEECSLDPRLLVNTTAPSFRVARTHQLMWRHAQRAAYALPLIEAAEGDVATASLRGASAALLASAHLRAVRSEPELAIGALWSRIRADVEQLATRFNAHVAIPWQTSSMTTPLVIAAPLLAGEQAAGALLAAVRSASTAAQVNTAACAQHTAAYLDAMAARAAAAHWSPRRAHAVLWHAEVELAAAVRAVHDVAQWLSFLHSALDAPGERPARWSTAADHVAAVHARASAAHEAVAAFALPEEVRACWARALVHVTGSALHCLWAVEREFAALVADAGGDGATLRVRMEGADAMSAVHTIAGVWAANGAVHFDSSHHLLLAAPPPTARRAPLTRTARAAASHGDLRAAPAPCLEPGYFGDPCTPCGVGQYCPGDGVAHVCSNAPVDGEYVAGSHITAECPFRCTTPFTYRSGDVCAATPLGMYAPDGTADVLPCEPAEGTRSMVQFVGGGDRTSTSCATHYVQQVRVDTAVDVGESFSLEMDVRMDMGVLAALERVMLVSSDGAWDLSVSTAAVAGHAHLSLQPYNASVPSLISTAFPWHSEAWMRVQVVGDHSLRSVQFAVNGVPLGVPWFDATERVVGGGATLLGGTQATALSSWWLLGSLRNVRVARVRMPLLLLDASAEDGDGSLHCAPHMHAPVCVASALPPACACPPLHVRVWRGAVWTLRLGAAGDTSALLGLSHVSMEALDGSSIALVACEADEGSSCTALPLGGGWSASRPGDVRVELRTAVPVDVALLRVHAPSAALGVRAPATLGLEVDGHVVLAPHHVVWQVDGRAVWSDRAATRADSPATACVPCGGGAVFAQQPQSGAAHCACADGFVRHEGVCAAALPAAAPPVFSVADAERVENGTRLRITPVGDVADGSELVVQVDSRVANGTQHEIRAPAALGVALTLVNDVSVRALVEQPGHLPGGAALSTYHVVDRLASPVVWPALDVDGEDTHVASAPLAVVLLARDKRGRVHFSLDDTAVTAASPVHVETKPIGVPLNYTLRWAAIDADGVLLPSHEKSVHLRDGRVYTVAPAAEERVAEERVWFFGVHYCEVTNPILCMVLCLGMFVVLPLLACAGACLWARAKRHALRKRTLRERRTDFETRHRGGAARARKRRARAHESRPPREPRRKLVAAHKALTALTARPRGVALCGECGTATATWRCCDCDTLQCAACSARVHATGGSHVQQRLLVCDACEAACAMLCVCAECALYLCRACAGGQSAAHAGHRLGVLHAWDACDERVAAVHCAACARRLCVECELRAHIGALSSHSRSAEPSARMGVRRA